MCKYASTFNFCFKIETTFNINYVQAMTRRMYCDSVGLLMQVQDLVNICCRW